MALLRARVLMCGLSEVDDDGVEREERDTLCFIYFFSLVSLFFFLCLFFWIYKIISLKVSGKKRAILVEEEEKNKRGIVEKRKKKRRIVFFFLCGNGRQLYTN